MADGQDYSLAGAYALLAVPSLPIQAVTVDSAAAGFPGTNLADGNLGTHWDNGGYRSPTAWVAVDLGAPASLGGLVLKTPPSAAGTSYDVQTSPDGSSWTTVLAAQASTSWNPTTQLLPPGTSGRWVRIFWHNSAQAPVAHFSLYELAVQGSVGDAGPGPTPTPVCGSGPGGGGGPDPGPAPTATPPPQPSVLGPFSLINATAGVVQFRPTKSRLRVDITGDTAGADARLEPLGPDFCALDSAWRLTASCNIRLAGTDTCVIPGGPFELPLFAVPGEDGVLSGADGAGDIAEATWPALAPGEPPGPPLLRIQVPQWSSDVFSGVALDAAYTLKAVKADGNEITWVCQGRDLIVP